MVRQGIQELSRSINTEEGSDYAEGHTRAKVYFPEICCTEKILVMLGWELMQRSFRVVFWGHSKDTEQNILASKQKEPVT